MSSTDVALLFLPESFKHLLNRLVVGKNAVTKVASVGKAIMQCIRPWVLVAPLQLGLGYNFTSIVDIKTFSGLNDAQWSHKEQKCQAIT